MEKPELIKENTDRLYTNFKLLNDKIYLKLNFERQVTNYKKIFVTHLKQNEDIFKYTELPN